MARLANHNTWISAAGEDITNRVDAAAQIIWARA
jgi:hypothetical protein